MNKIKKINNIKDNVKVLKIKDSDRIVIFSDCHRGDGTFKDSLYPNINIYTTALRYYYNEGFTYIEAGDGDELWKFKSLDDIYEAHQDEYKILNDFKKDSRLIMIYGNHDMEKSKRFFKRKISKFRNRALKNFYSGLSIEQGIVLSFGEKKEFLIFHGHQIDFINNELARVSKFLVRYVWGFLNGVLSVKEISSPAKSILARENIDKTLIEWCKENNSSAIIGHTHHPVFPNTKEPQYFNSGACVLPYALTCIEIRNGTISLMKWTIRSIENGVLAVKKEVISLPKLI